MIVLLVFNLKPRKRNIERAYGDYRTNNEGVYAVFDVKRAAQFYLNFNSLIKCLILILESGIFYARKALISPVRTEVIGYLDWYLVSYYGELDETL